MSTYFLSYSIVHTETDYYYHAKTKVSRFLCKVQGHYVLIQSYHRLFILQIFRHVRFVLRVCTFGNVLPYGIHQNDITHHYENACSGVTLSPTPHL